MAAMSDRHSEISCPQVEDCARATQALTEIWRICLNHLKPDSDPEASLSAIICVLDPWPLSTKPGKEDDARRASD